LHHGQDGIGKHAYDKGEDNSEQHKSHRGFRFAFAVDGGRRGGGFLFDFVLVDDAYDAKVQVDEQTEGYACADESCHVVVDDAKLGFV
jgi:hypothetical protein